MEKAKIAAAGYDVYMLHQAWLSHWNTQGKPELGSPDAAFIGFCKKRAEMNPIY